MVESLKPTLDNTHLASFSLSRNDEELLITADTIVPGVHYFAEIDAHLIGQKLAAVNLSDIAAMGGTPRATVLQISGYDPTVLKDALWLREFSEGLRDELERYHVQLLGTSFSHGPPTFTLQLLGTVPKGKALRRDGAKTGDTLFLTGTVGDAALALALGLRDERTGFKSLIAKRLHRPEPRVNMGQALRGIANSAIDISDGLAGDAEHIASRSGVGAVLIADKIPRSIAFNTLIGAKEPLAFCLYGGDDYELLFTTPADRRPEVEWVAQSVQCPVTAIGTMSNEHQGVWLEQPDGVLSKITPSGYRHFTPQRNNSSSVGKSH